MSDLKAYILFPVANRHPLYESWLAECPIKTQIVAHYNTNWSPPEDAGIVITHLHYRWEEISILRRIVVADRVPVLILADGITEYRNTFENPGLGDGALFQPLIGHKLACIGRSQARWIESWGNVGKCEVIGLPRLDWLVREFHKPALERDNSDSFELLISSARTPFFDDHQRAITVNSMEDMKTWAEQTPQVHGRTLNVTWRLNDELYEALELPAEPKRREPIHDVLHRVDAVITTPSTLQLESALHRRPTAVLDYHNCPQLTPAAWVIAGPKHIPQTVEELSQSSPTKMLIQTTLLRDNLQCEDEAKARLVKLIDVMIQHGQDARSQNHHLNFPARVIGDDSAGFMAVESIAELSKLFPDNPAFQDQSVSRLQTELSAAVVEMGHYPEKYFTQRDANRRSRKYINWLRIMLRNRGAMIEDLLRENNELKNQLPKDPVKND